MGVVLPEDDWTEREDPLAELTRLAETAGAVVLGGITQRRTSPDATYFMGRGKALEVADLARSHKADVIIADNNLSPAQIRNWEKLCGVKVVDRTELILDIFATRAKTQQAKTQVELAQLEYLLPRLKRMWTHLERYEGGIGTRGPGEKQLEVDKRLVNNRIRDLKHFLDEMGDRKRREVSRRHDFFLACLVGYTNAGKSTLMNRLTQAGVLVEDKLFSTLDTRTRNWRLGRGKEVLLSDTVGFIRKLPHHLIASFHATLEEASQADLLLHVIDASHPQFERQVASVHGVLHDLGYQSKPCVMVFNKADAVRDLVYVKAVQESHPQSVLVSAATGEGIDDLLRAVSRAYERTVVEAELVLHAGDGRLLSILARRSEIIGQNYEGDLVRMRTRIDRRLLDQLTGENGNGLLQVASICE
ncbi:MAG: GTPase HflX [Planctomycetes bacterium]|nr:GTPase HflX [Planctomycetota bacterium]